MKLSIGESTLDRKKKEKDMQIFDIKSCVITLVIALLALYLFSYMPYIIKGVQLKLYGKGSICCEDCINNGVACKLHHNYSNMAMEKVYADNTVDNIVYYFEGDDVNFRVVYYGNIEYNILCEECKENEEECLRCKWYRELNAKAYTKILDALKQDSTNSGLTDSSLEQLTELGYIESGTDKEKLSSQLQDVFYTVIYEQGFDRDYSIEEIIPMIIHKNIV